MTDVSRFPRIKVGHICRNGMGETITRDLLSPAGVGLPVYSASEQEEEFGWLENPRTVLTEGDLVVGARGSIGLCRFIDRPSTSTQTTIWVKPNRKRILPRFLYWVFTGLRAELFPFDKTAIPMLTVDDLRSGKIPLPPLHQQRAITAFLDRETAKIDALIAKQEELVERIEEHKRAYIFAGVTKGIDPAAALKSSGVAWLGDVPSHWEIRPLKRFVQFHAGAGFPDVEQGLNDQELPFFKVKDLGARGTKEVLTTTDNSISRETAKRLRAYVFSPKTIVMAKIGAALLMNRFRMVGVECCLDNNMLGLECDKLQIDPDFALMLMSTVLDMRMLVNPGAVPSLNETRLGRLAVAAPSLAEQRVIVSRLRSTTDELDRLRQAAGRVVESLQERRSTLITAAVTGQIEVVANITAEAAA